MDLSKVLSNNIKKVNADECYSGPKKIEIARDDRPYDFLKKNNEGLEVKSNKGNVERNQAKIKYPHRIELNDVNESSDGKYEKIKINSNENEQKGNLTQQKQKIPENNDNLNRKEELLNPSGKKTLKDLEERNKQYPLYEITGHERKFIEYLFGLSKLYKLEKVGPISTQDILSATGVNSITLKTILQRLKRKNVIEVTSKKGINGWRVFKISHQIYHSLLSEEKLLASLKKNAEEAKAEVEASEENQKALELDTFVHGSTILKQHSSTLPDEWSKIDFCGLDSKGFTKNHLIQLFKDYKKTPDSMLDSDAVQYSIYCFAFDLKHNLEKLKAKYIDPLSTFIGCLSNGRPFNSLTPGNFLTPKQEAVQKYISSKMQEVAITTEQEERVRGLKYNEWISNLPEEELLGFCSESEMVGVPEKVRRTLRRKKALDFSENYFDAEVWPSLKSTLFTASN